MGKITIPPSFIRKRTITVTIKKDSNPSKAKILEQRLMKHSKASKARVEKLSELFKKLLADNSDSANR